MHCGICETGLLGVFVQESGQHDTFYTHNNLYTLAITSSGELWSYRSRTYGQYKFSVLLTPVGAYSIKSLAVMSDVSLAIEACCLPCYHRHISVRDWRTPAAFWGEITATRRDYRH